MADPIAEFLATNLERSAARDPFLNIGRAVQGAQIPVREGDYKTALIGSLAQGLIGGLAGGAGEARVLGRQRALAGDLAGRLAHPTLAGRVAALQEDPRYATLVPGMINQEIDRRNQLAQLQMEQDIKTRGQALGKGLMVDPQTGQYVQAPGYAQSVAGIGATEAGARQAAQLRQKAKYEPYIAAATETAKRGAARPFEIDKFLRESGGDVRKIEDGLRKELNQNKATKDLLDVKPLLQTMIGLKDVDTRAADIALIGAFARIQDPGSTVREGEVKIAEAAQSQIGANLMGQINAVAFGGQKLTAETRAQMLQAAQIKVGQFENNYADVARTYANIAQRAGASPENVLILEPVKGPDIAAEVPAAPSASKEALDPLLNSGVLKKNEVDQFRKLSPQDQQDLIRFRSERGGSTS